MGFHNRVMIADDDPGIVDFLSIMLEFNGYIVTSTLDGSTLFQLEDQLPDLLLLDIWMSGVDGRDVCKYLVVPQKVVFNLGAKKFQ